MRAVESRLFQTVSAVGLAGSLVLSGCAMPSKENPQPGNDPDVSFTPDTVPNTVTSSTEIPVKVGPLSGFIIFASSRTGHYQLFDKNPAEPEKPATQLMHSSGNDQNPQISRDGKRLVYYSDAGGTSQIMLLNLFQPDTAPLQLTKNTARNDDPTFMPDGRIVFKSTLSGQDQGDLWIMDPDGSNQIQLTSVVGVADSEEWKPVALDNNHVLFTVRDPKNPRVGDRLYILDISDLKHITYRRFLPVETQQWYSEVSPDGSHVAYVSKTSDGYDAIFVSNADGSDAHVVNPIGLPPGDKDDPSWAGDNLLFLFNPGDGYDIYSTDLKSSVRLIDKSPSGNDLSPVMVP